ncbi:MAG TPA: VWA domain-containing protein [Abditibacteriaceae bacterium]|jgi:Ca-activated chloride channel family protein
MNPITIRTALDKDFRPPRGDFLQTLMIELTPARGLSNLPLNLGILLDNSGSMEGAKLENAKSACALLLQQLQPHDRAAVCVFSSGARTIAPSQMFDDNAKRSALNAVSQLQIEGATEVLAGLNQVYAEVAPHRTPDVTTFVILLSDGEPTDANGYRVEDLQPFLNRAATEFQTNGVALSTIGLGSAADYDAAFLRELADKGTGKFLMAQQPQELADAFQDEFGRIQSTVISDVAIEVSKLEGTVRRFWRVVPDKKIFDPPKVVGGSFRVPVGSLQNDQPQAYLVDIVSATPANAQGRGMLCQVSVNSAAGKSDATVLTGYSENELELAQRNNEVLKLNEEAVDFKLQMDLEDAVKSGDRQKMTTVLERKKKMTQRLGKSTATKILDDMQATLQSGGDIAPDDLATSSVESKKTKRLG